MKLELSDKKVERSRFEKIQKIIGYKFPQQIYLLLKDNDGAYPVPDCFTYYDLYMKCEIGAGLGAFLSINPDESGDILATYEDPPEFFPKGLVAFAEDGGGNFICFDYREDATTDNPPIVYWNHEADIGKDVSFVAKDFETFIGMLRSEDELEN